MADPRVAAAPAGLRRVLMIAPTSFFADYGCHVRILEQARGLAARGHQVVLCTYHSGRDIAGLDIRRTPALPWRRAAEVGSSWHKLALDFFLFFLVLRTAWDMRPDVLHAYLHEGALIGAVVGRLLGIPLLFDYQGSLTGEMADHGFLNPRGLAFGPLLWLERWIDRRPALILANAEHSARLLREEFGIPSGRLRLVPDCVDAGRFMPAETTEVVTTDAGARRVVTTSVVSEGPAGNAADAELSQLRRDLNIPPNALLLVYLGLLAPYQGIDLLLRAVKALDPALRAHLLVMGFPNVERYRQMAGALGIAECVTFTGAIRYDDAPRLLALGDIAVAPKISATEGSGKLLNYMAMGLPTVAFDTAVSREYLGEAGVLAPASDADAFAAALTRLIQHPDERRERGCRLRRRALELFTCERSIEAIERAYTAVRSRASVG